MSRTSPKKNSQDGKKMFKMTWTFPNELLRHFSQFSFLLAFSRNSGRQLVAPNEPQQPFRNLQDVAAVDIMDNRIEDIELDEDKDDGILDSILGEGAQSRIVTQVSDWLVGKATENPGCVERFVCETYRTGESLSGIPYGVMQLTKWV